jgi:hypothetical protein
MELVRTMIVLKLLSLILKIKIRSYTMSIRQKAIPILLVLVLVLIASCQQIFTFSPLSFLQRDPSKLPPEQQIAYAEGALASGDAETMAVAYNLINGSDDPNVALLASDLAIGASGLTDALTTALGGGDPEEAFDSINTDMLANAPAEFQNALDNGAEPGSEQYVNAAAALAMTTILALPQGFDDPAIDWEAVPATPPELQTSLDWAAAGGVDIADFFSGF